MRSLKSLLISAQSPVESYGSGQRLISLRRSLERLGPCRFLWLHPEPPPPEHEWADYVAPLGLPLRPTRWDWIWRQVTFKEFRGYRPALRKLGEIRREYPFDLAVCTFFAASAAAPVGLAPCMLDVDSLSRPNSLVTRALWPLTRKMMNRCASKFARVFIIRRSDGIVLDGVRTTLLPCISATAGPPLDLEPGASNLLFVGGLDWPPNRRAIEFLLEAVKPRLEALGCPFHLRFVGSGTERYAGIPGVSAGGFVRDLPAEYRRAAISLCPVWEGGGANVKLAESIQFGCAVLASDHAARGFSGVLVPGEHFLVARTESEFALLVCRLSEDPELRAGLRRNAARAATTLLTQGSLDRIVGEAVRDLFPEISPSGGSS